MLEILAYYTQKYGDKKLPNSLKKGLAKAFAKFNEYQLAKYNKKGKVWLRDILRIAHPKPANDVQAALWGRVASDTLRPPETWEEADIILERKKGAKKPKTFTKKTVKKKKARKKTAKKKSSA